MKATADELSAQIEAQNVRIGTLRAENERLKVDVNRYRQQIDSLRETINSLEENQLVVETQLAEAQRPTL